MPRSHRVRQRPVSAPSSHRPRWRSSLQGKWARTFAVGALVVLVSFDRAHACRWFGGRSWCVSPCVTTVWSTRSWCYDDASCCACDACGDCCDACAYRLCAGCGDPSWVTTGTCGDDRACDTEAEERPAPPVTPQPKAAREPAADASPPTPPAEPQAKPKLPEIVVPPVTETPPAAPPALETRPEETPVLDRVDEDPTDPPVETPPAGQPQTPPALPTPSTVPTTPETATPASATEAAPAAADPDGASAEGKTGGSDSPPPAIEPQPDKKDAPKNDVDDSLEGLFDSAGHDRPAGRQLRRWTDDTSQYSCRGRLIGVTADHVRILKVNGRTTTVPLMRLSRADRRFVQTVATRHTPTAHVAKK